MANGYSHVLGDVDSTDKHTSQSTMVVERLNILDVLTADRVVARLTSEHAPKNKEGHVITLRTKFENLRISGYAAEVEFDHSFFLSRATFDELSKNAAELKNSGRMAQESHGVILCSLVKSLKVGSPRTRLMSIRIYLYADLMSATLYCCTMGRGEGPRDHGSTFREDLCRRNAAGTGLQKDHPAARGSGLAASGLVGGGPGSHQRAHLAIKKRFLLACLVSCCLCGCDPFKRPQHLYEEGWRELNKGNLGQAMQDADRGLKLYTSPQQ